MLSDHFHSVAQRRPINHQMTSFCVGVAASVLLRGVSVRGGAPGPRPYGRRTLPASSLCIRRRSVVRGCGLVTDALLSGDIGLDDAISLQQMQQRHRERRGRCSAWYADCGLTGGCQALVVGR